MVGPDSNNRSDVEVLTYPPDTLINNVLSEGGSIHTCKGGIP